MIETIKFESEPFHIQKNAFLSFKIQRAYCKFKFQPFPEQWDPGKDWMNLNLMFSDSKERLFDKSHVSFT